MEQVMDKDNCVQKPKQKNIIMYRLVNYCCSVSCILTPWDPFWSGKSVLLWFLRWNLFFLSAVCSSRLYTLISFLLCCTSWWYCCIFINWILNSVYFNDIFILNRISRIDILFERGENMNEHHHWIVLYIKRTIYDFVFFFFLQKKKASALYEFKPETQGELGFCKGDIITVLEEVDNNWWKGEHNGQEGLFPAAYVRKMDL